MFRLGGHGPLRPASGRAARATLPADAAAAVALPQPLPSPPAPFAPGRGRVVLVVEDELFVRNVQREVLLEAGFRVLDAGSAEAALALAAGFADGIDVLVSDLTLPGLPGCELAARLLRARPGLGVVFTSGYGDDWSPCERFPGSVFLQKPFSIEGLAAAVDRVAGVPAREVPQVAPAGLPAGA